MLIHKIGIHPISEINQKPMDNLNTTEKDFLYRYHNNISPTGHESSGQKLWLDYIRPYVDVVEIDNYGTAYGIINPDADYRVVIEAHADEISWYVNYISDSGFINVIRNGGSDHIIAPSMRVWLHGEKGKVQGVFGWPAIHVRHGKDENLSPSMDNIFVDIGAKDKAAVHEMGIYVGTVITFQDDFTEINDTFYAGRALDNRMGGFAIAQVVKKLHENKDKLPFALYVVNAVQEEIGLRGAEMITQRIKPHVAIITDVTHDTSTPLMNSKTQGDIRCGLGPSIKHAPAVHNKLRELIIQTATDKEIPFQRGAASRSTGTDTDAFAYSNGGVPSALISIPLRYMHTTVEMAHKDDVQAVTDLIYETLLRIEQNHNWKYF
jgi:putative aminopeptidase FrvX